MAYYKHRDSDGREYCLNDEEEARHNDAMGAIGAFVFRLLFNMFYPIILSISYPKSEEGFLAILLPIGVTILYIFLYWWLSKGGRVAGFISLAAAFISLFLDTPEQYYFATVVVGVVIAVINTICWLLSRRSKS